MGELLGDHKRCPHCDEWGWFGGKSAVDQHRCKPTWLWQVEFVHGTELWDEVHANDVEQAAEKATEKYDEGDHPLLDMRGRPEVEIKIKNPTTGEITHWIGSAELVPHYRAEPKRAALIAEERGTK